MQTASQLVDKRPCELQREVELAQRNRRNLCAWRIRWAMTPGVELRLAVLAGQTCAAELQNAAP